MTCCKLDDIRIIRIAGGHLIENTVQIHDVLRYHNQYDFKLAVIQFRVLDQR